MNFDGHTNLGIFPTSKSSGRIHEGPVEGMVEHLLTNKIDAHICLYPRDDYMMLEEVARLTPHIRHIGLQVVMGRFKEEPTDVKNFTYDVNDITRSFKYGGLCHGIKLASHRGWWVRDGVVDSGLNYADSRFIGNILKKLPENAMCSFHMQGEPTFSSPPVSQMIAMYAQKFGHLKFIANHCGDYGQAMLSNRPAAYTDPSHGSPFGPPLRHAHSRAVIMSTILYTNDLHNLMAESSIFTPFKAYSLKDCKRWIIGSDYPFQDQPEFYLKERRKFELNGHPVEKIQEMNKSIISWIDNDWKENVKIHEDEYNYRFIPERKKQKVRPE